MDRQRLLHTLREQLQTELFLGAKWLPRPLSANRQSGEMRKKDKAHLLAELARELMECNRCPALRNRLHVVPGEGNPDARLMFVGEAPGATEDQQGRPFVGRAGQLLTTIIEAMGLRRQDVYIGNILKCRPPDNREPLATEIAECISYLHRQIAIIEPEIIVALGAYAARTLLDVTTSIGDLRGKIHHYYPTPMSEPIKLIATYHPAYLLRNYSVDNRRRVWHDMQMVLRELGLPIPENEKT